MKKPKGSYPTHKIAPAEWRDTPIITGDYDLDATIMHRHNKDLPHRLELYTRRTKSPYGALTSYNAIQNYHGDA